MTHHPTVSMMKGARIHPVQDLPRPGTKIRRLYDALAAAPGTWVPIHPPDIGYLQPSHMATAIRYLTDSYGFDIRFRPSGKHGVPSSYMLAGEHVGNAYLDFVADPTLAGAHLPMTALTPDLVIVGARPEWVYDPADFPGFTPAQIRAGMTVPAAKS